MAILAADWVALSVMYWLAVIGRYWVSPEYTLSFYLQLYPVVGIFIAAFFVCGLYPGILLHPAEEVRRVFYCASSLFLLIATTTFLFHNAAIYSRSVFLVTWAAVAPFVLLARHVARQRFAGKPWFGIGAIVLGSSPAAKRVIRSLKDTRLGMRITGVLTEDQIGAWESDLPPILGSFSSAAEIATAGAASYAIIVLPDKSSAEISQIIRDRCVGFERVLFVPDLPGVCSLGITAREIAGSVGFEMPQRLFHSGARAVKRVIDLVASALGLLLLSPFLVLIAAVIKITSRGPVLYRNERFGLGGRPFHAFKFRTMVTNGDEVLNEYFANRPDLLLYWENHHKLKEDPRVTVIGRWLRRFSLDELPQLLNVLIGEMSLVGPRPILPGEVPKYGMSYKTYARVRPGMTGLWQVSGRNNTAYEERISFAEYYVHNWSIWLDFYTLARTVRVVLTGDGAY
jgi:Undecaprenyl-phosphate galactose phosphotransferase WbaP